MMRAAALGIAGLAVIAGCSSTGGASGAPDVTAVDDRAAPTGALSLNTPRALGALPQTQLPERSCGMILWTLDAQRPSPVFRYVANKDANIVVDGRLFSLTRVDASGQMGFGVYERQIFANENDGLRVEVSSQFGVGFDGGSYLERGLVKVYGADGWSIVAPAAGIAGCR